MASDNEELTIELHPDPELVHNLEESSSLTHYLTKLFTELMPDPEDCRRSCPPTPGRTIPELQRGTHSPEESSSSSDSEESTTSQTPRTNSPATGWANTPPSLPVQDRFCWTCGRQGHEPYLCPLVAPPSPATSEKAQLFCWTCAKFGHAPYLCPIWHQPTNPATPPAVSPTETRRPAKERLGPYCRPDPEETLICFKCGVSGHHYQACPDPTPKTVCYRCGKPGVTVKTCPTCGPEWRAQGPYIPRVGKNVPLAVIEEWTRLAKRSRHSQNK